MNHEDSTYHYTYSAKQQAEVEQIRLKYVAPTENKLEQLRQLDQKVTQKGTIYAILVGVVSTLIFGIGLTFILLKTAYFIVGIILGVIGLIGMSVAYPLYLEVVKRSRREIAPEILKLTNDLLKS